jgi:hypothetical protein
MDSFAPIIFHLWTACYSSSPGVAAHPDACRSPTSCYRCTLYTRNNRTPVHNRHPRPLAHPSREVCRAADSELDTAAGRTRSART